MSGDDARRPDGPGADENVVDREFAGEHGTTALPGSVDDERHPEIDPQTPGGAVKKAAAEASEGKDPVDKAKRVLEEVDRQIAGEYERREDPAASDPGSPGIADGDERRS